MLEFSPRLPGILQVEVGIAELVQEEFVFCSETGLDSLAVNQEILCIVQSNEG